MYNNQVRDQALALRTEEHLSLREISKRLKLPKSTLSLWLKDHPLPKGTAKRRMSEAGQASSKARRAKSYQATAQRSNLHQLLGDRKPTRAQKARISEAAVLVRLAVMGWEVYGSPFDGDKFDWVVDTGLRLVKVQVKTTYLQSMGSPVVRLQCADGRGKSRRYREGELDFVVGYDLFTDTAYVWSWAEVRDHATISVTPEAAERWDKL